MTTVRDELQAWIDDLDETLTVLRYQLTQLRAAAETLEGAQQRQGGQDERGD